MSDEQNKEQSSCCQGSACCSPAASAGSGRGNRWKMVIFSGVILLAYAVTAYSLLGRRSTATGSDCCPTDSVASVAVTGEVVTADGLHEMLSGATLALVVFPRFGDSLSPDIGAAINSVRTEIGADSTGLRTLTLYPDNPAYIVAINNYDINEYPAILALGNNISRVLTQSAINKNTMLDLYRQSKAASSSCCPTGKATK